MIRAPHFLLKGKGWVPPDSTGVNAKAWRQSTKSRPRQVRALALSVTGAFDDELTPLWFLLSSAAKPAQLPWCGVGEKISVLSTPSTSRELELRTDTPLNKVHAAERARERDVENHDELVALERHFSQLLAVCLTFFLNGTPDLARGVGSDT